MLLKCHLLHWDSQYAVLLEDSVKKKMRWKFSNMLKFSLTWKTENLSVYSDAYPSIKITDNTAKSRQISLQKECQSHIYLGQGLK